MHTYEKWGSVPCEYSGALLSEGKRQVGRARTNKFEVCWSASWQFRLRLAVNKARRKNQSNKYGEGFNKPPNTTLPPEIEASYKSGPLWSKMVVFWCSVFVFPGFAVFVFCWKKKKKLPVIVPDTSLDFEFLIEEMCSSFCSYCFKPIEEIRDQPSTATGLSYSASRQYMPRLWCAIARCFVNNVSIIKLYTSWASEVWRWV